MLDTPLVTLDCPAAGLRVLLVTVTVTVHPPPPAGMVSPVKVRLVAPEMKLLDEAPAQVPPADWLAAMDMFVRESVNPAPVSGMTLLPTRVNVRVEVPPCWIVAGPNALEMLGGPVTVRVAVLDTGPAGRSDVLTPLEVLVWTPAELLVTVRVMVQPAEGMVMPLKFRLV